MTEPDDPTLQVVFGRAFLSELRRGEIDRARLFARAFLVHCPPTGVVARGPS